MTILGLRSVEEGNKCVAGRGTRSDTMFIYFHLLSDPYSDPFHLFSSNFRSISPIVIHFQIQKWETRVLLEEVLPPELISQWGQNCSIIIFIYVMSMSPSHSMTMIVIWHRWWTTPSMSWPWTPMRSVAESATALAGRFPFHWVFLGYCQDTADRFSSFLGFFWDMRVIIMIMIMMTMQVTAGKIVEGHEPPATIQPFASGRFSPSLSSISLIT